MELVLTAKVQPSYPTKDDKYHDMCVVLEAFDVR